MKFDVETFAKKATENILRDELEKEAKKAVDAYMVENRDKIQDACKKRLEGVSIDAIADSIFASLSNVCVEYAPFRVPKAPLPKMTEDSEEENGED